MGFLFTFMGISVGVLPGVDVENFFKWNQVTIQQLDGTWAEYVHIQDGCKMQRELK